MGFKHFLIEDWRRTRNQILEVDEILANLAQRFSYTKTEDGLGAEDMFGIEIVNGKPRVVEIKIPIQRLRELMIQYSSVRADAAPRMAAMAIRMVRDNIRWDEDDPRAIPPALRFRPPPEERI